MKIDFSKLLSKTKKVIETYPLVLLSAIVMAIGIDFQVNNSWSEENAQIHYIVTKILLTATLGISLNFAFKMISQRISPFNWIAILGLPFLILFYFTLPSNNDDFNKVYIYILVPIYILSHLLVSFIAYLKRENTVQNFWYFNKNLLVHFLLSIIFAGVLLLGILVALLAIENLFNVNINGIVYERIATLLSIVGHNFIFLSLNDSGIDNLEKENEYPIILKFFTQYILIPLLFIYGVILYAYSAKILFTWELPRGWVTYLIMTYATVGIFALLLVYPLKENTDKTWIKSFGKIFYYTLIPLLILLYVAIFTRILTYAFTEPRYYVLLLATWLTSIVLYFTFHKQATIKFIPISLFVFGVFALFFPYLNSFSIAKRSQKQSFEQILVENNLLKSGKIDFNKAINDSIAFELENKFEFLIDRHQQNFLFQFLDDTTKSKAQTKGDIKHRFELDGFRFYNQFKNIITQDSFLKPEEGLHLASKEIIYNIEDYQYIFIQQFMDNQEFTIREDNFKIIQQDKKNQIILNNKDTLDFIPKIQQLFSNYKNAQNIISIEGSLGKYHIKTIYQTLDRSSAKDVLPNYWFTGAIYLIDEKH